MNKDKITVTMPITEYEDLVADVKWWQGRFNDLKRIVLKYADRDNQGIYTIEDCVGLADDMEVYLNDEDY